MEPKTEEELFLEGMVRGIVQYPGEVNVVRTVDERGVLLTINMNQADIPLVIGRKGETAMAIRKIMKVFGGRHKANISVLLNEPYRSSDRQPQYSPGIATTV